MLGRLLRYDLRSMYKKFAILWPAVLIVAFLNQMVVWGAEKASFFLELGGLEFLFELAPAVVYFGLMVALVVVSMFYVVLRFYQGLLGDEGYLMHTLPVKPWQLVASKLLTATMTVIVSGLVGILSIAILVTKDGGKAGEHLPGCRRSAAPVQGVHRLYRLPGVLRPDGLYALGQHHQDLCRLRHRPAEQ